MFQFRTVGIVCLMSLACVGCGNNGNLSVYPVAGKVLLDGKPMEGGGSIAFIPADGQDGKAAGGVIDEDGNYILSTYADGDGSIPGKFRVVIVQSAADEPEATPDGTAPREAITYLAVEKLIPPIYSDFRGSPLSATVEKKANELDFDLKRDAGQTAPRQTGA